MESILFVGCAIAALFFFKCVDKAASALARRIWGDYAKDDDEMRVW